MFGTGRFVAADVTDRDRPEWPPHPARLFAGLVEAWQKHGSDPPDPDERDALEWLEQQPPPSICDPGGSPRRSVGVFVPVNNATDPNPKDQTPGVTRWWTLLPEERKRAPRLSVPSTLVNDGGRVVLIWPRSDPTSARRDALAALLQRVTRMGHSSSFVACRLIDDPPDPVWEPHPGSQGSAFWVRGTFAGMLEVLMTRHEAYLGTGLRNLPLPSETVFYASNRIPVTHSAPSAQEVHREWVVFEMHRSARSVSSAQAASLAKALRGAILSHCEGAPPELLVGKDAGGRPTTTPHALFLSLPFVGHRYSDGTVKGMAMLFPDSSHADERRTVLRAVGAWQAACRDRPLNLRLSSRGVLRLRPVSNFEAKDTLSLGRDRWSQPSRRWGSVTALALPRDAHKLTHGCPSDVRRAWRRASEAVAEACRFVGLPEPSAIDVGFDPPVRGGSHVSDYAAFIQGGRKRALLHAVIQFDHPVAGPLVLGSGRYRGLGLMLPLDTGGIEK